MAEITHEHLAALADRIEGSVRRDVDLLRGDVKDDLRQVHARVSELRDSMAKQNGRVDRAEENISKLQADVRVVSHDFVNHVNVHGPARPPAATDQVHVKPGNVFVAGMAAAVIALAGVAHGAWDVLVPIVKKLLK